MNRDAWDLLGRVTEAMVSDPASDVVYAGEYEGRWAVRMRQTVREATTIWFEVGDLTLGYEAYVLPGPAHNRERVYRQLLARNHRMYRCVFSLDGEGDVYLRGRVTLAALSAETIDAVIGAVYEAVELSFPSLIRLLSDREKQP